VALARLARSTPRIQGSQAHQPLDALAVDAVALCLDFATQAAAAVERPAQMDFVDEPHQRQIPR